MKRMTVLFAALMLGAIAAAQEFVLDMAWDDDDFTGFEGGLVLPHRKGAEEEVLRSIRPGQSSDGTIRVSPALAGGQAAWTATRLSPGRYGFFVTDLASAQGMTDPGTFARSGLTVRVRTKAGMQVFSPPDKPGLIWHVCDIYGETGEIVPVDMVYPWKTVVYGYVRDALTGKGLAGVNVRMVKKGDGRVVDQVTNAAGQYVMTADFGAWDLEYAYKDYIAWNDSVAFIKSEYPIRVDVVLSPPTTDTQFRFVLSWGAKPADLDANALGPTPGGGAFHISYRAMRTWERRHFLDIDAMNGYGPETITLEKLDPGVYLFVVHDYSAGGSKTSVALSYSGAMVRVFREDKEIARVQIREGQPGTWWRVLALDGRTGKVTVLDQYGYDREEALRR